MIKAAFFDIDGTLYSHKTWQVSKSTRKALEMLQKQGVLLFTATGRHISIIEYLLQDCVSFDGYVTLTGQICLDREKRLFYENPIPQEDADEIAHLFAEKKILLTFIEQNRRYINFVTEDIRKSLGGKSPFVPPVDVYRGASLYQASGSFGKEEARRLLPGVKNCRFTQWKPDATDIIPASGGKMIGIQKLLEHYQLSSEEIIAFGDGENDIDMLEFAKIGVAMGNSPAEVKEHADYVAGDIDSEGIADALRHFDFI